jgi:3-isopropylmalate/(R)-2-methylmalate dehydratase large subunit
MKVEFSGAFRDGVYSKDAILKLIAEIGIGGANGHVIEYTGEAVCAMTMEERMTVCNMSIECGARAGIISPDDTTLDYLKNREFSPKPFDAARAEEYWRSFASDEGASYDKEIVINVSQLEPMVTWGTNPEQAIGISESIPTLESLASTHRANAKAALKYVGLKSGDAISGTPVQWAFVGSCTNGRIEDLRKVASILKGRKVSSSVTFYVVPGSEQVREKAISEGLDKIFVESGAQFRMPGCSMCLAMNDDKVPAGERCISSSNRNFVGRQGKDSITHLASPATVAASAVRGEICSVNSLLGEK